MIDSCHGDKREFEGVSQKFVALVVATAQHRGIWRVDTAKLTVHGILTTIDLQSEVLSVWCELIERTEDWSA